MLPTDKTLFVSLREECEYSDGEDGDESDVDSLIGYKDALEDAVVDVLFQINARADATQKMRDLEIIHHAFETGSFQLSQERRAQIDPLGTLHAGRNWEALLEELTDDERSAAVEAGYDDFWQTASREMSETDDALEVQIETYGEIARLITERFS